MALLMATELTVRGESVQALYSRYKQDRFQVNRRYQRKLVWSVDEKSKLIDSMLLNLPIPLFLVAETGVEAAAQLEIIDGMQRLNAVFSFIENEFTVGGKYFDLNTLAETKLLVDEGHLTQKQPKLEREACADFANYQLPLSVFRYESPDVVDEAFRRINSGGRRLSPQELRQAGTLSELADVVRTISSRVRTDTSPSDLVPLAKMKELSISNRDLDYGVQVEDIFWVRHGILRRDDLRLSQDEELVLDLLIDILSDPLETSQKNDRDNYYNYGSDPSKNRSEEYSRAIHVYTNEALISDFFETHDALEAVLPTRFATHIGVSSGGRAPRYWHAVYLAFYELMHKDHLTVSSESGASQALHNIAKTTLRIPRGSGTWTSENKRELIDAVKGILRRHFEPRENEHRSPRYGWKSEFQTILGNARVEQTLFECKQGILNLSPVEPVEEDSRFIEKLQKTLTAMANTAPNAEGFLMIGISDSSDDTARIRSLYSVEPARHRDFDIVGVDREAKRMNLTPHDYFERLITKVSGGSDLTPEMADMIRRNARVIIYEGHTVIVFSVTGLDRPQPYGENFYQRNGSHTEKVPATSLGALFDRFRVTVQR